MSSPQPVLPRLEDYELTAIEQGCVIVPYLPRTGAQLLMPLCPDDRQAAYQRLLRRVRAASRRRYARFERPADREILSDWPQDYLLPILARECERVRARRGRWVRAAQEACLTLDARVFTHDPAVSVLWVEGNDARTVAQRALERYGPYEVWCGTRISQRLAQAPWNTRVGPGPARESLPGVDVR